MVSSSPSFLTTIYFHLRVHIPQDVDYEATMAAKLSIAKRMFMQDKDLILNSISFQKFFSENEVLDVSV